ncbi:hypothetical protein [Staphylococcus aureus]|uniref:hypothetical protein n=1 Tax=Staphylococcus aureus TaxID=1280 RepID=UPI0028F6D2E9|nr:hypothetical protein [Staphylococcus aureus]
MKIIKLFSIISLFLLVFSANFSNAYANEEQKSSLLENQKEKLKSKKHRSITNDQERNKFSRTIAK